MTSRCLLPGLVLALLACGAVVADEGDADTRAAAEAAERAFTEGDTGRLAALAGREHPDAWVVADALCQRGAPAAALAFARVVPGADAAGLVAYLEARGDTEPVLPVRLAFDALEEASTPEALDLALEGAWAVRGTGDAYERVLLETARANALGRMQRYGEAAEVFLDAGGMAVQLGWLAHASRLYTAAGEAAYFDRDLALVLTAWERRLEVEERRVRPRDVAEARMFVGLAHFFLGDGEAARRALEESLAAHEALQDEDGIAWVLNNLATLYHRYGEHGREQDALERALRLARKLDNTKRQADVLHDLGGLHAHLRDRDRATACLNEAIVLYRALGEDRGVHQCLGMLAHVLYTEGEWEGAIGLFNEALAYFREAGDREFTCGTLNGLGYTLFKSGEMDRAEELLEEAVALGETIEDPWWEAHARQSLADLLIARERYTDAERELDHSLGDARRLDSPTLSMIANRGFAELWLAKGDPARASRASERAMENAQAMLAGLGHLEAARVRDGVTRVYAVAARSAVAWGRPEAVFTAVENARSGALLEALENRTEIWAARIPEELRAEERVARLEAQAALRRYQDAVADGQRAEIRRARAVLDAAQDEVHAVVARIQRRAKRPASVLYPRAATLAQVQEELEPGEVLVSYSLVADEAFALVVTSDTARIVSLGSSEALGEVAALRPEVDDEDPASAISDLRARLIGPLSLDRATRRLLVSPDGTLAFTPFSLLLPDVEIAYVPSGTAYRVLRRESTERGHGVLALGDPNYEALHPDEGGGAPPRGVRLVPLPATRDEAIGVGDVVLLGRQASREGLLEALAQRERWEALHLACHGLVDPARPANTGLALALQADGPSLLRLEEIFTLRVPADLTVLSACETGRGTIYRSEGLMGLAQAFMLAGSPRVLVSLWKVDDDATKALMLAFYEAWRPKDGRPRVGAAAALKRAQERVRSDPDHPAWRHPHYWAAWVLWGLPD